jgi:hypothetical protein
MGAQQGVSMGQVYREAPIAAPMSASANTVLISTDSKESGLWLWQGEAPSQPSPPGPNLGPGKFFRASPLLQDGLAG